MYSFDKLKIGKVHQIVSNLFTGVVLIVLSKAFYCTPHDLLIAKLHNYGLDSEKLIFLNSCSRNSKQYVKINKKSQVYHKALYQVRYYSTYSLSTYLTYSLSIIVLQQSVISLAALIKTWEAVDLIKTLEAQGEFSKRWFNNK